MPEKVADKQPAARADGGAQRPQTKPLDSAGKTTAESAPWEIAAAVERISIEETGCAVDLQPLAAAGALWARLPSTHANYNALYSALLVCWINKAKVIASVSRRVGAPDEKHVDLLSIEVGDYAEAQFTRYGEGLR